MDVFLWCGYNAQISTTTIVDNVLTAFYGKAIAMDYTQFGAPIINDDRYISISHSHSVIVISVSDCPIGCDVERMLPRNYERIVQYLHLPHCHDLSEFYHQWTALEARYKIGDVNCAIKHFPLNENYLLAIACNDDNINLYNIQDILLTEDLWFLKR